MPLALFLTLNFDCWAQGHMVWGISLGSCSGYGLSQPLEHPQTLKGRFRVTALMLREHCSSVAKTLMCYYHCSDYKYTMRLLWGKLTSSLPDSVQFPNRKNKRLCVINFHHISTWIEMADVLWTKMLMPHILLERNSSYWQINHSSLLKPRHALWKLLFFSTSAVAPTGAGISMHIRRSSKPKNRSRRHVHCWNIIISIYEWVFKLCFWSSEGLGDEGSLNWRTVLLSFCEMKEQTHQLCRFGGKEGYCLHFSVHLYFRSSV